MSKPVPYSVGCSLMNGQMLAISRLGDVDGAEHLILINSDKTSYIDLGTIDIAAPALQFALDRLSAHIE